MITRRITFHYYIRYTKRPHKDYNSYTALVERTTFYLFGIFPIYSRDDSVRTNL